MFPGSVRYHVGDIVTLKKVHPCGSTDWEITRTGIDFGLRCVRCGRHVLLPRAKFEKQVKAIVRYALDRPPGEQVRPAQPDPVTGRGSRSSPASRGREASRFTKASPKHRSARSVRGERPGRKSGAGGSPGRGASGSGRGGQRSKGSSEGPPEPGPPEDGRR